MVNGPKLSDRYLLTTKENPPAWYTASSVPGSPGASFSKEAPQVTS